MKQVLVIRKDLNMRKGKMVAQGSHACLKASMSILGSRKLADWIEDGQTKICVSVDSLEELLMIHENAKLANLPRAIVLDAGKTEFNQPTYTAVAIGPADDAEIDKITGHLKLL